MKFVTYIRTYKDFQLFHQAVSDAGYTLEEQNQCELIVSVKTLNRFLETSQDDLMEIIKLNQQLKYKLLLEWDVLNQELKFQKAVELFKTLPLHEFSSVRVQDPGALHFVKESYPWVKCELILENGNHNLEGLKKWIDFGGDSLKKCILSNELSRDHLSHYVKEIKCDLEILAFGRILLFYSPRKLLSPLNEMKLSADKLEAYGTSEESPHSGFPIVENQHGTFMFNVKDLSLLENIKEIKSLGVKSLRYDLRFEDTFSMLTNILQLHFQKIDSEIPIMEVKSKNARPLIKGFYNINKSDVLFPKLKNSRIQRMDKNYLGEVVDVERDHHIALILKAKDLSLNLGDTIMFVTPEGKVKESMVKDIRKSNDLKVTEAHTHDFVLLPYLSGVVGKTQVYKISHT